jgi:class 3 adenylate cyclase
MKTDISGSTSRFRELLAADLQALLGEHRDFLARHAAKHDGHIIKDAGDGHWLEFPGVTGAAKASRCRRSCAWHSQTVVTTALRYVSSSQ